MRRILDFGFWILDWTTYDRNLKSKIQNLKYLVQRAIGIAFGTLAWLPALAWACPLCKEGLFAPGESAAQFQAARAYAWSIEAMLVIPVLLIAGIAWLVIRSARRARDGVHSQE